MVQLRKRENLWYESGVARIRLQSETEAAEASE